MQVIHAVCKEKQVARPAYPAPEIRFGDHILIPDLAGWREDRYPQEEPHNWISVAPDWICEVLSPRTMRIDKMEKMPIYARSSICLVRRSVAKGLDAFRSKGGEWVLAGLFAEAAKVRVEPFTAIEINLSDLWQESRRGQSVEVPKE